MFFLFISGSELSKVPGLSAAGANPDVVPLTAPADSDVVQYGWPKTIDFFPMDPQGHPTPAIVTRAAVEEAKIPVCVLRVGSYLPPAAPYVELGGEFGQDPRKGLAVPDALELFDRSRTWARTFEPGEPCMLAETIPGGTTTALLVLRALGYSDFMVSSAAPENPINLKEQIWQETSSRLGSRLEAISQDPLAIVRELGDPMQAAVLGFMAGLCDCGTRRVSLAGGTQMLAVAALFKRYALASGKMPDLDIEVATTCYVARDKSSSFLSFAERIGVRASVAEIDFSDSPFEGLRDYEKGFVKEGVGAGGAVVYASRLGVSPERVVSRTNALYGQIEEKAKH